MESSNLKTISLGAVALLLLGWVGCGPTHEPAAPEKTPQTQAAPAVAPAPAPQPASEPCPPPLPPGASVLQRQARAIFGLLPATMPGAETDTPAMAVLGKELYFDKDLSMNRTQSCNDCHQVDLNRAGVDYRSTSQGAEGKLGGRNAPTVLNAGFQMAQFWDGRAVDLAEQATGPMLNPVEMGMPTLDILLQRIKAKNSYRIAFAQIFAGQINPITKANLAHVVAAYERTLITHSRFDEFLAGKADALTPREKQGLTLFLDQGCVRCHNSPVLGGQLYQKIGLFHPYADKKDLGRYEVTKNPADKYVFKVPILTNITLTPPYFHDGKVETLAEAVELMAWLQLDQKWGRDEILPMLEFLNSLADRGRTTALAPTPGNAPASWNPPQPQDIPEGNQAARRGWKLIRDTHALLGRPAHKKFVGNKLDCAHCHQADGAKAFGLSWVGVTQRYPKFSARMGREGSLEERINGCLARSMNGQPLPPQGKAMQDIVAYFTYLSQGVTDKMAGAGAPPLNYPNREAELSGGQRDFAIYCQACHGRDGAGYQDKAGVVLTPPLWGKGSFNNGAGMDRLLTAAAFVRVNMPLGVVWDDPYLTSEQAYDLTAYMVSQPRPEMAGLDRDYPDKTKKPVDAAYPPWADDFPAAQHKYGPFQPMLPSGGGN
ncbi:MAG: c-type cytochrome [Deltaproteobacteria bacterium]|nr:c-type cytochrome [Deltaproteobacteria bacterium]